MCCFEIHSHYLPWALQPTQSTHWQWIALSHSFLAVGEDRKIAAHAKACRSAGVSFIPLMAETIGGWSDKASDTNKCIGCLQGQRLGISVAKSTTHLFQRLACLPLEGECSYVGEKNPNQAPRGGWSCIVFLITLFFFCLLTYFTFPSISVCG